MSTLDVAIARAQKRSARLLLVARHRVTRWFRPAVAVERHHQSAPHPMPRSVIARPETGSFVNHAGA